MYLRTRVTPFFVSKFDMLMNKKWAYKENNEDSFLSCGESCGKRLPKIMERPIIWNSYDTRHPKLFHFWNNLVLKNKKNRDKMEVNWKLFNVIILGLGKLKIYPASGHFLWRPDPQSFPITISTLI